MKHSESKRPIQIEDILRLKRAERPPAEFWGEFDRQLRAKQLAALVSKGRAEFMSQFPSIDGGELAEPHARATFEACKLDRSQRDEEVRRMHRELLALRREHPFSEQRNDWLQGAVLGEQRFALRWYTGGEDDRLLLINLGDEETDIVPAGDPVLAAPSGGSWTATEPEKPGEMDALSGPVPEAMAASTSRDVVTWMA
jgi:hypothetical protein